MVRWWWLEGVQEFVENFTCVTMFVLIRETEKKGEDSGVTILLNKLVFISSI